MMLLEAFAPRSLVGVAACGRLPRACRSAAPSRASFAPSLSAMRAPSSARRLRLACLVTAPVGARKIWSDLGRRWLCYSQRFRAVGLTGKAGCLREIARLDRALKAGDH